MNRSLRKGNTTIEYWRGSDSDTIQSTNTEFELQSDHAIFRTTFKPVSDDQSIDADKVFPNKIKELTQISLNDAQIRKLTGKFLSAYKDRLSYIKLEIVYKKSYQFNVDIKPKDDDGLYINIKV